MIVKFPPVLAHPHVQLRAWPPGPSVSKGWKSNRNWAECFLHLFLISTCFLLFSLSTIHKRISKSRGDICSSVLMIQPLTPAIHNIVSVKE